MSTTLLARPSCPCHGRPMWRGRRPGRWLCAVAEGARNARRVRMNAGGIDFFVGRAPTADDAHTLRAKIKKEAPHGTVRIA